jgi:hypothetical protein
MQYKYILTLCGYFGSTGVWMQGLVLARQAWREDLNFTSKT